VMEKVLDYIRESRAELRKVTWPTKQQMWYSTLVVIVVTFMVSVYLGLVDLLLTGIFSKIVR
jgi:preprotein translocase subunit SecE